MNWVIGIVLDIILVAIVFFLCYKGSKDGFAKTVVSFLGFFIAIILAATLCKPAANLAYTSFIKQPVETAIETAIRDRTESIEEEAPSAATLLSGIEDALEKAPDFIKNIFATDEKKAELSDQIIEMYTADITELSQRAAETVIKPIVLSVLVVVAFALIFIIALLLCSLLSKALKLVNKIPLLGGVNALLGTVIGLLKGLIIVLIINWLLVMQTEGGGNIFGIITAETIQSSLIMKNLAIINPLNAIVGSIFSAK